MYNPAMPRTNSDGTKQGRSTTQESGASASREAEGAQCQKWLSEKEARLSSGLTTRGDVITAEQIETLQQIIEMQRLKLAELTADGR